MEGVALNEQQDKNVADNIKIVSMLYNGAVNFIVKAREKMEVGDSIGKTHFINKTSAIIRELSGSLNMEGGEVARNLKNLYDFVLESLTRADADNNMKALNDAEKVVDILRSAWQEMQESGRV